MKHLTDNYDKMVGKKKADKKEIPAQGRGFHGFSAAS
jgi:hypothetical protein